MIRHKCDLLITVELNYLISVYGLQKISFFYVHACVACVSIGHQKKRVESFRLMERAVK